MRRVVDSRIEPNRFARALFSPLPDRYDLLSDVLSLGQHRRWRQELVDRIAKHSPRVVLDVATGTGGVAFELASEGMSVIGVDLTPEMIRRGKTIAKEMAEDRVAFLAGAAERLPFADEAFDALSVTYLLRYVLDPAATLRELARVVKPGGVIASLEFFAPKSPLLKAGWLVYTRLLLPIIGLAAGGWRWFNVGRFLGPSIAEHYRSYPLEWQLDAWQSAGITELGYRTMTLGAGIVVWGRKRGNG